MLPEVDLQQIGFLPLGEMPAELADGTMASLSAYAGTILWGEAEIPMIAVGGGTQPLVGVKLLEGHQLTIDFRPFGRMDITPLD